MADSERIVVDFRTEPRRYKHWKLSFDGPVATLHMDVKEDGGLVPGYELKILDPQPHALHQPHSCPVQESRHQFDGSRLGVRHDPCTGRRCSLCLSNIQAGFDPSI